MSAPTFAELLRKRVEEEGVTKVQLAKRLGVSDSSIATWIAGGRPKPRYYHVLARFVRVPVAQMDVWFPEEERKAQYRRRRAA